MALLAGFVLFCGKGVLSARPEVQEEKSIQSFIRMDQLPSDPSPLKPPLRNIFVPLRSGITARNYPAQAGDVPSGSAFFPQPGDRSSFRLESSAPTVRYVGYIDSGTKIVGLVLFREEAMAVVEGELLTEDIRVGTITPDNIEIHVRDSESKLFSLEGETP